LGFQINIIRNHETKQEKIKFQLIQVYLLNIAIFTRVDTNTILDTRCLRQAQATNNEQLPELVEGNEK
jgi:hypothetical protein